MARHRHHGERAGSRRLHHQHPLQGLQGQAPLPRREQLRPRPGPDPEVQREGGRGPRERGPGGLRHAPRPGAPLVDPRLLQAERLDAAEAVRHAHVRHADQGLRPDPPAQPGLEPVDRGHRAQGLDAERAPLQPDDRRARHQRPPRRRPAAVRGDEADPRRAHGLPGLGRRLRDDHQGLRAAEGVREGPGALRPDAGARGPARPGGLQLAHRRLQPRRQHGLRGKALHRHGRRRLRAGPHHLQHPHQGLLHPRRAGSGDGALLSDAQEGHQAGRHCVQQPPRRLRQEADAHAL
mmetsp:Transcript_70569/g.185009  ORF Transcript_70569/g.185009 Transcript_70569/m.185009 type:complete len:293 (-) Transcript_70569:744-1622(-)